MDEVRTAEPVDEDEDVLVKVVLENVVLGPNEAVENEVTLGVDGALVTGAEAKVADGAAITMVGLPNDPKDELEKLEVVGPKAVDGAELPPKLKLELPELPKLRLPKLNELLPELLPELKDEPLDPNEPEENGAVYEVPALIAALEIGPEFAAAPAELRVE